MELYTSIRILIEDQLREVGKKMGKGGQDYRSPN